MARALRPVVVLMLVASALFVAAGLLDAVYPGGAGWSWGLAALSYAFALVNTFVAVLVARGSERSLALRMGLSIFFVLERPASAFLLAAKSAPSVGVHLATALVELVILASAVRVWRLGHSVVPGDLDELLALDAELAAPAASDAEPATTAPAALPGRTSWLIGGLAILLAALFVADGLRAGFFPGGRTWDLSPAGSGWLAYLFAVVPLAVATRAVHGGRLALGTLTIVVVLLFAERVLSSIAPPILDPVLLSGRALAAAVALALAVVSAGALRGARRSTDDASTLEAA